MSKPRIAIDINEVLRGTFQSFLRHYESEYGLIDDDEIVYSYDYFKDYEWAEEELIEEILREDLDETISPNEYVIDEATGRAPVDAIAFRKEVTLLSPEDVFNEFMYVEYVYQIFGGAPEAYRNLSADFQIFHKKYSEDYDLILVSKDNPIVVPSTLFFLSKIKTKISTIKFVKSSEEMWNSCDILITTDPDIVNSEVPKDKSLVKFSRPYNSESEVDGDFLQLCDLVDEENKKEKVNKFKKILKKYGK